MSTGLTGVKPGDEVVLTDVNRKGPWRARVESVGRKYARIDRQKFELDTGTVADAYRHTHAYTLAQWERERLAADLDTAVRSVGGIRSFATLSDEDMREATRMLREVVRRLTPSS